MEKEKPNKREADLRAFRAKHFMEMPPPSEPEPKPLSNLAKKVDAAIKAGRSPWDKN